MVSRPLPSHLHPLLTKRPSQFNYFCTFSQSINMQLLLNISYNFASLQLPPPMMYPPQGPPPMFHPNLMPPGYVPTSPEPTHFIHPQDLEYLYRSQRSQHGHQNQLMMDYDTQREEERNQRKWEKRQRREQERQAAFTYTGLDRTIAEDFLEQQEKSTKTSESLSSSVTSSSEEEYNRNRRYGDVAM